MIMRQVVCDICGRRTRMYSPVLIGRSIDVCKDCKERLIIIRDKMIEANKYGKKLKVDFVEENNEQV